MLDLLLARSLREIDGNKWELDGEVLKKDERVTKSAPFVIKADLKTYSVRYSSPARFTNPEPDDHV